MTSETRRPGSDPQFDARAVSAAPNDSVSPGGAMTRWLVVVLAVVIVAGGLFGYDQGVISGALPGIKADFSLSVLMVQVVTSWVTLGALVGSSLREHFNPMVSAWYHLRVPVVVAVKVTEVPAGTEAGAGEMLRVGGVGPKEPLKQLVRTRGKAHAGRVKMARRRFMGVPRLVPIEGRISPVCAGG